MVEETIKNYKNEIQEKLRKKYFMSEEEILQDITRIEMKPSLLIMSGGLDTTTLLYLLYEKKLPLEVLSFDYGQEAIKEIEIAKKHCDKLRIKQTIIKIDGDIGGNLTENGDKQHEDSTLIPNRNSIFLSMGVSYALQHGIERVYYGAIKTDITYNDCQPIYVHHFNILSTVCDFRDVQIRAPFINLHKYEIMDMAISLGIDLTETWTCLKNGDKPCGVCNTCFERKEEEQKYRNKLNNKLNQINKSLNNYEK